MNSVTASLSPETRILLASAGPHGIHRVLSEVRVREVDWDLLTGLAVRERAVSELWRQLDDERAAECPSEVRQRLQRLVAIARFNSANLSARLDETLEAFGAAGVDVVLLKGAGLARSLYPSFESRPMGDIDVLVEPDQLARALSAAQSAGWRRSDSVATAEEYERHQHVPPLSDSRGTDAKLEIHTELFVRGHPFGISGRTVFAEAVMVSRHPGGGRVLVPARMHSLLHVAVHFAWAHTLQFGVWRMIRDLTLLTSEPQFDWQAAVAVARSHHAGTSLFWSLRLARDLGGVAVPDGVLQELRPYRSERLLSALARHFALQLLPSDASCPSVLLSRQLWRAAIRPRWSGHASSRPWDSSPESVHRQPLPLDARLRRQFADIATWGRYVRRVVSARSVSS